jgi:hypothetical protein
MAMIAMKRQWLVILSFGCLMCAIASPAMAGWGQAKLIGQGVYGSLAVDSAGTSHIVYVRSARGSGVDLVYVTYNQHRARGTILVTQLPVNVLGGASIAIDSHNVPHVALIGYPFGGPFQLQYLDLEGNQWHAQTVDPNVLGEGFQAIITPLALDSSDHPHIAYIGSDQSLAHASSTDGSGWQIEDTGLPVDPTSIRAGGDGTVHIAGINLQNEQVCEERGLNGTWSGECFDDATFQNPPCVGLAPGGIPEVVYGDIATAKLARFDGTDWSIRRVADASHLGVNGIYSTAFAIDSTGSAKIMFVGDGKHQELIYGEQQGATFNLTDLGNANFGLSDISLAVDSEGLPHATFWASTAGGAYQLYAAQTLPDLTGQWLSITPKVSSRGAIVRGQIVVNNLGTSPATGFKVNYYLSADNQLDQTDELVGNGSIGVGAGQQKVITFTSHPLSGAVSGEYLIASINPGNQIAEANTNNNIAAIQIP